MHFKKAIPFFLLLSALGQGLYFAASTGQTTDETAYAGSAYPNLRYGDYRYTGEHPPMSLHLGALPLLFLRPEFPFKDPVLINQGGTEIDLAKNGARFLYKMGNNPDQLLFWQRAPIVLLMTVTGFFLFRWSSRLFGYWGGVTSLALYAFCPNILTHGSLFTTDFTLTSFFFLASYALFSFFERPTGRRAVGAGALVGCALLSKVSALALIPAVFLIFGAAFFKSDSIPDSWMKNLRFGKLFYVTAFFLLVMSFGSKVVMPALGPFCLLALSWFPVLEPYAKAKRLVKYGLLLSGWIGCAIYSVKLFYKYPAPVALVIAAWIFTALAVLIWIHRGAMSPVRQLILKLVISIAFSAAMALILGYLDFLHALSRFAPFDHFMRVFNVVLSHSSAGHTHCVEGSWVVCDRRYFPSLILVKTSVVALFLSVLGIFLLARKKQLSFFPKAAIFAPPLIFFLVAVFLSKINIGLRHILPVYPFLFLFAGAAAESAAGVKIRWLRFSAAGALVASLLFYAGRTLKESPHYLSYFAEWVGSAEQGARLVSDSNINWGQDNRRLAETLIQNKIPHIFIQSPQLNVELNDYYGLSWEPVSTINQTALKPGFYALSIDTLQAHRKYPDSPFLKLKPVLTAGKTYLIYKIPETRSDV